MTNATKSEIDRHRVMIYTRRGCHLCDEARELLERCGLLPEEIDIDTDPALTKRFDACVPVVEIDGRVRFRGVIQPVLLRRIIRNLHRVP